MFRPFHPNKQNSFPFLLPSVKPKTKYIRKTYVSVERELSQKTQSWAYNFVTKNPKLPQY